jgi:peptide/nickel transport system substrate-binding protein
MRSPAFAKTCWSLLRRRATKEGLALAALIAVVTAVAMPSPTSAATKSVSSKKSAAKAPSKKSATKATVASEATTSQPPATATPASTAVPVTTVPSPGRGGILVAAISQDPGQLNPAITTAGAVHSASELMYNGLVEIDENGKLVPELAESWTVSSGDYTFRLRKGVSWHDGKPFTSADVKYTFEDPLPKFHARARASLLDAVKVIETPDPLTVIFRFYKPYSAFLQQLNVTEAPILPAHLYAGTDASRNPYNLKPVGTGPFVFDSYKPGAELRLKANANYFKAGLPYLDGVVLRVIPDAGNQLIALEAGEVDFLYGVNGADLSRVKANKSLSTLETLTNPGGSNCIMSMSFNLEKPIFADQRTRQGILQGLDRKQFLDRILFGQGKVASAPIASGIPFAYAKDLKIPGFDKVAAARLLDEAGWKQVGGSGTRTAQSVSGVRDGTQLRFRFLSFPTFALYGQLIKAQLGEIGVDVQLETADNAPFADRVFVRRDFDTNVISYCNGTDPEIGVRRMYDSAQIGPVAFSNSSAYRNANVTKLFEDASTSSSVSFRGSIYRKIQEILVEDLPYIWLVETTATRVFRSTCSGFSESGHFAEAASCKK